jgi:simple sugar transport system substrate-binding protein
VNKGFTTAPVVNINCINCDADAATAVATVKAALAADPSIDGLVTLNPDIALGATDAAKDLNRSVKIGTFGTRPGVLDAIGSDAIAFAMTDNVWTQPLVAIEALYFMINYGYNPNQATGPILSGPTFITKDNLEFFKKMVSQNTF